MKNNILVTFAVIFLIIVVCSFLYTADPIKWEWCDNSIAVLSGIGLVITTAALIKDRKN